MASVWFHRRLRPANGSFFLFGPRSVGKSFWLHQHFKDVPFFNLLENRTFLELSRDSGLLEAKIGNQAPGTWICIDEIQKIPALLDEVHRLIEKKHFQFALSGSSARKLKRGGANLLAGRAVTKKMEALCFEELSQNFNLNQILEWGTLPLVFQRPDEAAEILSAYVHTYIKEEIREEGVIRKMDPFVRFLEVAGLFNGQQLNKENVARDAKVPRSTVDTYFSILEDTLLGSFLPAFRPELKVRERAHPKFYWFDNGVARGAAGLLYDPVDSIWKGKSLETLLLHELRVYNHTEGKNRPLFYYRTGNNAEIDFIIETRKRTATSKTHLVCLEVKLSKEWRREWERPMRDLARADKFVIEGMYGLYCGDESYHFDGVDILPVTTFLKMLYEGRVF
jgi:uncharacterized protein